MSDDNKNSDPFDFDFNALNEDEPQAQAGDAAFDLDNPFGDDIVVTRTEAAELPDATEDSFDLNNPFGDDLAPLSDEAGVSEENPYLNDSSMILPETDMEMESSIGTTDEPAQEEKADKKKKGLLSGILGGKKDKAAKEKPTKEKAPKEPKGKQAKPIKEKKEKAPKEKKEKTPGEPAVPRDWGTILCIVFSVVLLASLLIFNVATFLSRDEGSTLMGTLCFLGAFNIVFLALAAVPILFYKFPKERTLPNVMLGVSVGAVFTGVLFHVCNAYHYYGFVVSP